MLNFEQLKNTIAPILRQFDVTSAGIFGSWGRGEQKQDSDLDLLVKFSEPKSFFEIYNLESSLKKTTGLKIDLVSQKAVKKELLPFIQKDLQVVI